MYGIGRLGAGFLQNELILEFPTKSMNKYVRYSILMCASAITLPHSLVSSAKNRAASAGEPFIGSSVSRARLAATSGCLRPSTMSRLILSANTTGVAGGATRANQVTERKLGSPDSASVGTSAATGERSAPPTARILTLPARYIGTEVVR